VIVAPPLFNGAVQDTKDAALELLVPLTEVGALGTVAGVIALLGAEAAPVPWALVAVTLKV
jgi:hypothetical protein